MKLHYLSPEEETAIKKSIPWRMIDTNFLELVRFINTIKGIATVQSCEGHIKSTDTGFFVRSCAKVCFRANRKRTNQVLFDLAPEVGIEDVEIRYFGNGSFWINVGTHPTQSHKIQDLFRKMKRRK